MLLTVYFAGRDSQLCLEVQVDSPSSVKDICAQVGALSDTTRAGSGARARHRPCGAGVALMRQHYARLRRWSASALGSWEGSWAVQCGIARAAKTNAGPLPSPAAARAQVGAHLGKAVRLISGGRLLSDEEPLPPETPVVHACEACCSPAWAPEQELDDACSPSSDSSSPTAPEEPRGGCWVGA
jgi:hypothetical protein